MDLFIGGEKLKNINTKRMNITEIREKLLSECGKKEGNAGVPYIPSISRELVLEGSHPPNP